MLDSGRWTVDVAKEPRTCSRPLEQGERGGDGAIKEGDSRQSVRKRQARRKLKEVVVRSAASMCVRKAIV